MRIQFIPSAGCPFLCARPDGGYRLDLIRQVRHLAEQVIAGSQLAPQKHSQLIVPLGCGHQPRETLAHRAQADNRGRNEGQEPENGGWWRPGRIGGQYCPDGCTDEQ